MIGTETHLERGAHYHGCPECYENWECSLDCSIEPDLFDFINNREFGSYCTCPGCDPNSFGTLPNRLVYDGFVRSEKYQRKLNQVTKGLTDPAAATKFDAPAG